MGKPDTIIRFLHNFWIPEVLKTDKILELGCNCGVNLNHLRNLGYLNLYGIDINEIAITKMKEVFNEVYNNSNIYIGSLEETLPIIPDKSIDVTFSMAVLEHIHPDTTLKVCNEIKRITKKYIITCEDEVEEIPRYNRVFPKNHKLIFEHIGCHQIKYLNNTGIQQEEGKVYLKVDDEHINILRNIFEYKNYTTRMFKLT